MGLIQQQHASESRFDVLKTRVFIVCTVTILPPPRLYEKRTVYCMYAARKKNNTRFHWLKYSLYHRS